MICVCGVIVVMIDNETTKIRYFADTYFPFLPKSVSMQNGRVLQSFLGLPFPYVIPPFLSLLRLILPFRKTVMSFRARRGISFLLALIEMLRYRLGRDSSSLRSSEWHRLSSRTYVRDPSQYARLGSSRQNLSEWYITVSVTSLGRRFFISLCSIQNDIQNAHLVGESSLRFRCVQNNRYLKW